MRLVLPSLILLLAGCGEEAAPPPPPRPDPQAQAAPSPAPPSEAKMPPKKAAPAAGQDAAATLRRYYALIEAGDYQAAWAMRSGEKAGFERFRANFAAYESYRANVGTPSEPVAAGGWLHVEVPVMITGRMRGGEPFGTAGSVSLRKAAPDNEQAAARERAWHIYTG